MSSKHKKHLSENHPARETVARAPFFFEALNTKLLALVIVLLVAGVYANSVGGTFVWDDQTLVVRNEATKSFEHIRYIFINEFVNMMKYRGAIYRPLQELSYAADRFLYGLDPAGFHVTNIIFQIGSALALFYAVLAVSGSRFAAFFSAMAFGIHPVNTEAVAYISGRSDPMYMFFMLLAFLLYIRSVRAGPALARVACLAVSLGFYTCSLLSRETAVMFLLILAAYEAYGIREPARRNWLRIVPFVVLVGLYAVIRSGIVKSGSIHGAALPAAVALFVNSKILVCSASILAIPVNLHMWNTFGINYSIDAGQFILYMVVIAAAGLWLAAMAKKDGRIIFWLLWSGILILPHMNLIKLNAPFAEHWIYGSSIGVYATAGILLSNTLSRRNLPPSVVYVILAVVALYFSVFTVARNAEWKDEPSIYGNTLKYVKSPKVYTNLGVCYEIKGDYDKSIEAHKKAIEISPNTPLYHNNIALAYAKKGDTVTAVDHWKRSIALEPDQLDVLKLMRRYE